MAKKERRTAPRGCATAFFAQSLYPARLTKTPLPPRSAITVPCVRAAAPRGAATLRPVAGRSPVKHTSFPVRAAADPRSRRAAGVEPQPSPRRLEPTYGDGSAEKKCSRCGDRRIRPQRAPPYRAAQWRDGGGEGHRPPPWQRRRPPRHPAHSAQTHRIVHVTGSATFRVGPAPRPRPLTAKLMPQLVVVPPLKRKLPARGCVTKPALWRRQPRRRRGGIRSCPPLPHAQPATDGKCRRPALPSPPQPPKPGPTMPQTATSAVVSAYLVTPPASGAAAASRRQ